jgi:hypothetical protein
MLFLKGFLGFLWGLLFFYFYYRNLWVGSKIRSKEMKLSAKYGKDSPRIKRFRRRFGSFLYSRPFRFLLFIAFTFLVFMLLEKPGLVGFTLSLIGANLFLFPWGWKKTNPNGESS